MGVDGWVFGAEVALAAVELLLILYLVFQKKRVAATWVIALALAIIAFRTLAHAIPGLSGKVLTEPARLIYTWSASLYYSSILALPLVYPVWKPSMRRVGLLLACLVPPVTFLILALAVPQEFLVATGAWNWVALVIFITDAGALLVPFWVFGIRWLRTKPGPLRTQFLYVLVPFLLWAINDGVEFTTGVATGPDPGSSSGVRTLVLVHMALPAASALLFGAIVAVHWRKAAEAVRREDRWLLVWLLVGFAASTVQFLGANAAQARGFHLIVDGSWALVLAYGVARYHVLDIDLKLKLGIRGGVLGGAGLAVLLITQQLIEQLVGKTFGGRTFGAVLGAVIAGLLLFFLTPLQRLAHRLSTRALPRVNETDAYLDYRRLHIYRVALEGLLRDGRLDEKDQRTLHSLRTELSIQSSEHQALEREIRSRLQLA